MKKVIQILVYITALSTVPLLADTKDSVDDDYYPSEYAPHYYLTHVDFASPVEIATNTSNAGTVFYLQIKLVATKKSALRKFMQQHPNQGFHFEVGANLTCNVDPGWQKDTNSTVPITLSFPTFEKANAVAEPLIELSKL
jgi:hypothetical protein